MLIFYVKPVNDTINGGGKQQQAAKAQRFGRNVNWVKYAWLGANVGAGIAAGCLFAAAVVPAAAIGTVAGAAYGAAQIAGGVGFGGLALGMADAAWEGKRRKRDVAWLSSLDPCELLQAEFMFTDRNLDGRLSFDELHYATNKSETIEALMPFDTNNDAAFDPTEIFPFSCASVITHYIALSEMGREEYCQFTCCCCSPPKAFRLHRQRRTGLQRRLRWL